MQTFVDLSVVLMPYVVTFVVVPMVAFVCYATFRDARRAKAARLAATAHVAANAGAPLLAALREERERPNDRLAFERLAVEVTRTVLTMPDRHRPLVLGMLTVDSHRPRRHDVDALVRGIAPDRHDAPASTALAAAGPA